VLFQKIKLTQFNILEIGTTVMALDEIFFASSGVQKPCIVKKVEQNGFW
jgi:hypothetical protein